MSAWPDLAAIHGAEFHDRTIGTDNALSSACAASPAFATTRTAPPVLGEDGKRDRSEEGQFAHGAIAAAVTDCAARTAANCESLDTDRVATFQYLDVGSSRTKI